MATRAPENADNTVINFYFSTKDFEMNAIKVLSISNV